MIIYHCGEWPSQNQLPQTTLRGAVLSSPCMNMTISATKNEMWKGTLVLMFHLPCSGYVGRISVENDPPTVVGVGSGVRCSRSRAAEGRRAGVHVGRHRVGREVRDMRAREKCHHRCRLPGPGASGRLGQSQWRPEVEVSASGPGPWVRGTLMSLASPSSACPGPLRRSL